MTPLPDDSLVFKLAGHDTIPCAATQIQFEVAGEAAGLVDAELLKNAAAAVLHYFRTEEHRVSVSVEEFAAAMERVLHGLGLMHLKAASPAVVLPPAVAETDLRLLASDDLELLFFQRLRAELRRQLGPAPRLVRFHGLRECVKRLAGARRWSGRCQRLHDQIVDYLRTSLSAESPAHPCGLVVQ